MAIHLLPYTGGILRAEEISGIASSPTWVFQLTTSDNHPQDKVVLVDLTISTYTYTITTTTLLALPSSFIIQGTTSLRYLGTISMVAGSKLSALLSAPQGLTSTNIRVASLVAVAFPTVSPAHQLGFASHVLII